MLLLNWYLFACDFYMFFREKSAFTFKRTAQNTILYIHFSYCQSKLVSFSFPKNIFSTLRLST
jgi:hypothetical protein